MADLGRTLGSLLLVITLVVFAIVLFLPFVSDSWSDPWGRFLMFLAVLGVLLLVLVRLTMPRKEEGAVSEAIDIEIRAEEVETFMELAIQGQPYSQLNVYMELKHALMNRVRVRRNLSEDRWVYVLSNPNVLQRLVDDPELYRLTMLEDKGTVNLSQYQRLGVVIGDGFLARYEELLRKVEQWS